MGSGCWVRFRHQRSAVRIQSLANFIYFQLYQNCIEKTNINKRGRFWPKLKKLKYQLYSGARTYIILMDIFWNYKDGWPWIVGKGGLWVRIFWSLFWTFGTYNYMISQNLLVNQHPDCGEDTKTHYRKEGKTGIYNPLNGNFCESS